MGQKSLVAIGLVLILGNPSARAVNGPTKQTTQTVTGSQDALQPQPREPRDPLFHVNGADTKGCYGSTAAASAEVLRRNAFVDVAISDTLVCCLQGFLCGDSCASLMILNIADPTEPKFVSRLRFHDGAERGTAMCLGDNDVYLTIPAPDYQSLLLVVDVSVPGAPAIAGSYYLDGYVQGLYASDSLLYATCGYPNPGDEFNAVNILNVSDPSAIVPVSEVATEYGLDAIQVRGDHAYVVGMFDLYSIDITEHSSPSIASRLTTGYLPCDIDLGEADSIVYVADCDTYWPAYWSAFTTINVNDPAHPTILQQFSLFGAVTDVHVRNHWAYVSHGSCGLQVFDITNPAAPDSVTRFEVPSFAGHLAIEDTLLVMPDIGPFVVDAEGYACYPPTPGPGDPQEGDLLILSIADPTHPRLLGFYSPTPQDPTPVDDPPPDLLPSNFALYPNYPNPFNPGTVVAFDLPEKSEVRLTVYNLLGQQVKEVTETRPAGHHEMELNLSDEASGVYFYELRAGDHGGTGKMLLLK